LCGKTDSEGCNILHYALQNNLPLAVYRCIITCGVDINALNNMCATPLYLASWYPSEQTFERYKLLLEYGADPNIHPIFHGSQHVPLHYVIVQQTWHLDKLDPNIYAGVYQLLIEYGANVNYVGVNGKSALYWAFHNTKICTMLFEKWRKHISRCTKH
jgi:ankyrin repeat protein